MINDFDLNQRILEVNSANLTTNLEIFRLNKKNSNISRIQKRKDYLFVKSNIGGVKQ